MKSNINRRYIKVIIVVFTIIYFVGFVLIPKVVAQGVIDLILFYRVRFEVLGQSPKGHHYINLFDGYAQEITEILGSNPSLAWESIDVLLRFSPNLDALVNGHGDEVVISDDDVTSVKNYLNLIAQHASSELKSVIAEELSATPLETTAGMTMNQAWAYLNEDARFQDQVLELQYFPYLKSDSANIITGAFSENANYEISFNEENWILSSFNNGIEDSWIAENQNLSNCILTVPRSVSDPYLPLDVSYKTLGDVKYKVQTVDIDVKELMFLYILYQPIDIVGQPLQGDYPPFILYPQGSNTVQCIEQSEAVLASLHFVPVTDHQPVH
jgi:hypothetical protein